MKVTENLQIAYKNICLANNARQNHLEAPAAVPGGRLSAVPFGDATRRTALSALVLPSQFHRQRVIIRAGAEAIDQDMIKWFHIGQFTQEGDHVRGGAYVAKFA